MIVQKLITTYTNVEINICIHLRPQSFLNPKRLYHCGRADWCVIQFCDMLTEREGSCQASSNRSYRSWSSVSIEGFPTVERRLMKFPVNEFLAWACGYQMQCIVPRACQVLPVKLYGRVKCNVEGGV